MTAIKRCPVCFSSSLLLGDILYSLVDMTNVDIAVVEYDNEKLTIDLELYAQAVQYDCLECQRTFFLRQGG